MTTGSTSEGLDLRVFVAAHKDYEFPGDPVYRPIHVGRAGADARLPFAGDDTGENISALNRTYCELTGLYWAWRNTDHAACGLVHYRRYFAGAGKQPASGAEMARWLQDADVIVARRRHYVIETVRQQYSHAHHASDLDAARDALEALHPEHLRSFDAVMAARSLSLYNMFLMRRELLDAYCSWLFPVLERAAEQIPFDRYGPQQARVMGYVGERLFNVWLHHNDHLRIERRRVFNTEGEPLVRKGIDMVKRKFGQGRAE